MPLFPCGSAKWLNESLCSPNVPLSRSGNFSKVIDELPVQVLDDRLTHTQSVLSKFNSHNFGNLLDYGNIIKKLNDAQERSPREPATIASTCLKHQKRHSNR
jgi:hypothetical protein